MSVQSWLSARQKDGKRIEFLKTGEQTLRDMLRPLRCAILSIPPEYAFALRGMVKLLGRWTLYNQTILKEHYNHYTVLKDVLRQPRRKDVGQDLKLRHGPFLNNALGRIIHLCYQNLNETTRISWEIGSFLKGTQNGQFWAKCKGETLCKILEFWPFFWPNFVSLENR